MRLDKYICEYNNISRNKAQMLISDGSIQINGRLITKSSFIVNPEIDTIIISQNDKADYVSRSAIKLKKFLLSLLSKEEIIKTSDMICLDIGASTGGFTQILLEFGAHQVYALDVGTSQLDLSLKKNNRIVSIENTDVRKYVPKSDIGFDIITCDVSFISLTKILESIISLAGKHTEIILLYKPQFEVGKINLTKQNIPKNQNIIDTYLNNFCKLLKDSSIKIKKVEPSQLEGEAGNKEYFIWCQKG